MQIETKAIVKLSSLTKLNLQLLPQEGQVIVHIKTQACYDACYALKPCGILLDPNICLFTNISKQASALIATYNIKTAPATLYISKTNTFFSLIFQPLQKGATHFDFIEPGINGWKLLNIPRNKLDVYYLKIYRSETFLGWD